MTSYPISYRQMAASLMCTLAATLTFLAAAVGPATSQFI